MSKLNMSINASNSKSDLGIPKLNRNPTTLAMISGAGRKKVGNNTGGGSTSSGGMNDGGGSDGNKETFTDRKPFIMRNWKHYSPNDLKRLTRMERSRYLAYEDAPKSIVDAKVQCRRRVRLELEKKKLEEVLLENHKAHARVFDSAMGERASKEASDRLRRMHEIRINARRHEVEYLIARQHSSLTAITLQALVPTYKPTPITPFAEMTERDHLRVRHLLENELSTT